MPPEALARFRPSRFDGLRAGARLSFELPTMTMPSMLSGVDIETFINTIRQGESHGFTALHSVCGHHHRRHILDRPRNTQMKHPMQTQKP